MFGSIKTTAFSFVKTNFDKVVMLMIPYFVLALCSGYLSLMNSNSHSAGYTYTYNATSTLNYSGFNGIISFFLSIVTCIAIAQIYKAIYKGDYSKLSLAGSVDGFLPLIPAFLIYSIFLGLLIYMIVLIGALLVFTMLFYPFLIFVLLAVLIGIVYFTVRLSLSEMILSDLILDFSGNYSDKKDLNLLQKVMLSLNESWRLTRGQFWFLIVLGLSLIGWYFLVIISAGLAIIFVGPYFMAINATLYKHLIDSYKE